jgi:hypothetical protein
VIIVCGGRDFADQAGAWRLLDEEHQRHPIGLLIHGAARGADTIAEGWARDRQIEYRGVPALWKRFGKSAGPRRNARMVSILLHYRDQSWPVAAITVALCRSHGIEILGCYGA